MFRGEKVLLVVAHASKQGGKTVIARFVHIDWLQSVPDLYQFFFCTKNSFTLHAR
jgi:hypothetical protein